MNLRKIAYALAYAFLAFSSFSHAEECPQFFLGGLPPVAPQKAVLLCNSEFAVGYNTNFRDPLWSAELLTASEVARARALHGRAGFHQDHRLPSAAQAHLTDYRNSGWARGHLTPSGDMPDWQSRYETYALTNVMPQNSKMNSGPWEHIEQKTRSDALRAGKLYVVTGSAFLHEMGEIGANHIKIASLMWKAIYAPKENLSWVLICENAEPFLCRKITLSELVKTTGFQPFPAIGLKSPKP